MNEPRRSQPLATAKAEAIKHRLVLPCRLPDQYHDPRAGAASTARVLRRSKIGFGLLTCASWRRHAARMYSLIRPLRTGFRRILRAPKCAAGTRGAWCSLSGMRWAMPWCGRAVL